MKFNLACEHIDISDTEFGITITFKAKDNFKISMYETNEQKIMDAAGPYVMIQKSYGEDDEDDPEIDFSDPDIYFDGDYITLESSFDDFADDWDHCVLVLGRNNLLIKDETDTLEVNYDVDDATYEKLKNLLQSIDGEQGKLTFV